LPVRNYTSKIFPSEQREKTRRRKERRLYQDFLRKINLKIIIIIINKTNRDRYAGKSRQE